MYYIAYNNEVQYITMSNKKKKEREKVQYTVNGILIYNYALAADKIGVHYVSLLRYIKHGYIKVIRQKNPTKVGIAAKECERFMRRK